MSVERHFASFTYRAESWDAGRRVVAKVEWRPGELLPRVGFLITNFSVPAERVFDFYNHRGTAEQWIKEGKYAIRWTRLSCRAFAAPTRSRGAGSAPVGANTTAFPGVPPKRHQTGGFRLQGRIWASTRAPAPPDV